MPSRRRDLTRGTRSHSTDFLLRLHAGEACLGGERGALLAGAALLAALRDADSRAKLTATPGFDAAIAGAGGGERDRERAMAPLRVLLARAVRAAAGTDTALSGADAAALDAALAQLVPRDVAKREQRDELLGKGLEALGVGLFGFVYGRARWFLRLATAGTGVPVKRLALEAGKRSRVGVWLMGVLTVDALLNSVLLRHWTELRDDIQVVRDDAEALSRLQPVANAPARLTVPSVAAVAAAVGTTAALSRHRFVVLPLALALGQAHWDILG